MRISVFILLAIFTVQVFDIPPSRNMPNPHTCCGRAICMCKHGKGASCPFRHGLGDGNDKNQPDKKENGLSPMAQHPSCHLNKTEFRKPAREMKSSKASARFAFTKAPCAADTPKSVLPLYSKDFLFPGAAINFALMQQGTIPSSSFDAPRLLRARGIYRPPRGISFSF